MIPLFLCLLITFPISQGQYDDGPDGPDEDESPDDGGDCTDPDQYSNCPIIAENNWCDAKGYKGKCCASCKAHEDSKDPDCHDVAQGCVYYKEDMCKPDRYPDECKKACGECTPK